MCDFADVRKVIEMFSFYLVFVSLLTGAAHANSKNTYWVIDLEHIQVNVLGQKTYSNEEIKILLNTKEAPKTTAHIIKLVNSGFYDSQRILSVVYRPRPFNIGFGDPRSALLDDSFFWNQLAKYNYDNRPLSDLVDALDKETRSGTLKDSRGKPMAGNTGAKIPFEKTSLKFVAGTVGLTRPPLEKDSGDNLIFITLNPFSFLDGEYTAFGQIVDGVRKVKDLLPIIQPGDRFVRSRIVEENP